jgi:hypothetical protein
MSSSVPNWASNAWRVMFWRASLLKPGNDHPLKGQDGPRTRSEFPIEVQPAMIGM